MFVGIDIGGTFVRVAASADLENPQFLHKTKFETAQTFEQNLETIKKTINSFNVIVDAIGIGIAGGVNEEQVLMDATHNLPQFLNKPLGKTLASTYECKAHIGNDGILSALAQSYFAKEKISDFVFITWGTGLAIIQSVVHDSRAQVERLDRATHFPHWEEEIAGIGIYKTYGKRAEQLNSGEWDEIMKNFVAKLRVFIAQTQPKHIVFGGGISVKKWDLISLATRDLVQQTGVAIELTSLGEDVALYGAFALLRKIKHSKT